MGQTLKNILRRVLTGLVLLLVGLVLVPLIPLILIVTLIAVVWRRFDEWRLRRQFEAKWGKEGKELVLVYSNSPHWQDRIEKEILPRIRH